MFCVCSIHSNNIWYVIKVTLSIAASHTFFFFRYSYAADGGRPPFLPLSHFYIISCSTQRKRKAKLLRRDVEKSNYYSSERLAKPYFDFPPPQSSLSSPTSPMMTRGISTIVAGSGGLELSITESRPYPPTSWADETGSRVDSSATYYLPRSKQRRRRRHAHLFSYSGCCRHWNRRSPHSRVDSAHPRP